MSKIIITTPEELQSLISSEIDSKLAPLLDKLNSSDNPPIWLTVNAFAKKEGISRSMVYKLKNQNKIVTRKIGRKTQVKV